MAKKHKADIAAEVARVAAALGRTIEVLMVHGGRLPAWRLVQHCPICDLPLAEVLSGLQKDHPTVEQLHRVLFSLYDEHRCPAGKRPGELAERADLASVRMAERARQIVASGEPAGVPSLYERAEREAVLLAERAATLRRS